MSEDQKTVADATAIRRLSEAREKIVDQLSQVIVGQTAVIEELLIAMFCRGCTQYRTGTCDVAAKASTVARADREPSLSATTIE